MAVLSFFLILCRDGTGRGCVRRGSTNQPPDHRITASLTDSGLVPIPRAGSGGPGEYSHDYFCLQNEDICALFFSYHKDLAVNTVAWRLSLARYIVLST